MQLTISVAEALKGLEGVTVTAEDFETDYGAAFAEYPEPAEDAEVIEGDTLLARPVPQLQTSGFTHFADGAQFSRGAFYERGLPGRYAFMNAAVAVRKDREIMEMVAEASSRGIFAPWGRAVVALQNAGFEVHPVAVDLTDGMGAMAQKVADAVSAERNRLEHKTCVEWLASGNEGVLLVDGSIGQLINAVKGPANIVGLVKSHRKQYFTAATAATVLGLKEAERTSVFVVPSRRDQDSPTHSWYLRLRTDPYKNPAFGLVRVELPPADDTATVADRTSGWILAERAPLSLPDLRFDRLLYPIRAVELLLKAQHPSRYAVQSVIGF
ncbi:MAG: hypothetical protein M3R13_11670 [Armatimonadota bacterium]|nr:hypothetical protein [Armatimonadota bacterium]